MNVSKSIFFFTLSFVLIVVLFWNKYTVSSSERDFDAANKVVLRSIGHQLLILNNNSSTRVLPIVKSGENEFVLSFEDGLSFFPGDLISITQIEIVKSNLQQDYLIEVEQCDDREIAYSTELNENTDITSISCKVRRLPNNCYQIHFIILKESSTRYSTALFALTIISLILFVFSLYKKKGTKTNNKKEVLCVGIFELHLDQNKLIQKGEEINLSKKECEILHIFATQPNQIIKREELMKKVWEDNGVVVSRSLDTYISKLRKKLKNDENVQLINIHGVGYKLEVKS